ncbi:MAG: type IX secretion system membrane protein PorP/SprF [Bacteroidetes bacterium]|nr:type IX secretion system membrane protein PorP/SprF [Bacteroidota bacterium]
MYRLQLQKNHFLGFGLSFNARLFQSALSKVETEMVGDPQFQANSPTLFAPNFVFGAYYYSEHAFAGLSIPNLLYNSMIGNNGNIYKIATGFSPGKNHFYLHGGWKKDVGKYLYFEPSLLLKFVSGSPLQIDINSRILYRDVIGAGVSYRTMNTIAALVQYRMNIYISFGYAFSHNFSELAQYGSTSHELSLIYAIATGKGRFKIDVPRF